MGTEDMLATNGSESLLQSFDNIAGNWPVALEPLKANSNHNAQLLVEAFGMGSSVYNANTVGKPAKNIFACLVGRLGARPVQWKWEEERQKDSRNSLMVKDAKVGDAEVTFEKRINGVMNSIFWGVDVDLGLSTVVAIGNGIERYNNCRGKGKVNNKKGNAKRQEQQQMNQQPANVMVSSSLTSCR
ncbi:hypothetical protein ACHAXS_005631 [Conticribra weissflogii]